MKESRLFKILYYLLDKGSATAPELAKELEVSVRTIYRDIDTISSAGIPIYVTTGRTGGIHLMDDFVLNKALLSKKEKQDILSALQSLSLIGSTFNKDMLTKLSALFNIESEDWYEVDFSRWGPKTEDNEKFELLKNAVINHRALLITYVNTQGLECERKIYPLKLLYKSRAWYLKAYCTKRETFRIFKFNRIINFELLDESFTPLSFPKSQEAPNITYRKITLSFPKEMAYRVYDEFENNQREKCEDGRLIVTSEMPEDDWLIGYLLSFGTQVEIIKPEELRNTLKEAARKIYQKYKT